MTDTSNKHQEPADVEEGIPMQRIKPLWLAVAAGGVIVVAGLIGFAMSSNKKNAAEAQKLEQKAAAHMETPEQAREQRAAMKEHLAITRKSLEQVAEEDKVAKAAAQAKKAQEQQQKQEEAQKQASAAHAAPVVHRANKAAAKKMSSSLDNIGNNIASQLK